MTCTNLCVDILRDMGSGGGRKLGFPSTSCMGLTTAALTCCCDIAIFVYRYLFPAAILDFGRTEIRLVFAVSHDGLKLP